MGIDEEHFPVMRMSIVEVQRKPSDFQRHALERPLLITVRGDAKLVAMSLETYLRLSAKACAPPDRAGTTTEGSAEP